MTQTYTPMTWNQDLVLDLPFLDQVHEEFVDLLAETVQTEDDMLLPMWSRVIAHTQDHFDREDQWMEATQFGPRGCHSGQHAMILAVMRECEARGHGGDKAMVRQLAYELGIWFAEHAQTMDAGLAVHLKSCGFDPEAAHHSAPDASAATAAQPA
ncbi:hemerythrin domain-containing protein [Rhodoferax sp. OV413]|uniref:hemerythrin domain-containing protein n=1 Tax=Rhodoferax sp. OV413 TaxID=1855285 RepID=UPI0025F34516|nr:hemerythrin domain-containing protein [Rhodoferax sp. OV413]